MEILKKLNDRFSLKFHVGVYASDLLPEKCRKPAAIIMNDMSSNYAGRHWSCAFLPARGRGEYFCSYGLSPTVPNHVKFLKRHSKNYTFNRKILQSMGSTYCGLYCVLFLANRMSKVSMSKFLTCYGSDTELNDRITHEMGNYLLKNM